MANPKFRNINDASDEYTWDTLGIQPEPDVASARDFVHVDMEQRDGTGKLIELYAASRRRVWGVEWICDEAQIEELQRWHEMGAFYLFIDSGEATNYPVVWEEAEFRPEWLRGGKFRLAATFREAAA